MRWGALVVISLHFFTFLRVFFTFFKLFLSFFLILDSLCKLIVLNFVHFKHVFVVQNDLSSFQLRVDGCYCVFYLLIVWVCLLS